MTNLRTAAQQALSALTLWSNGRDMDAVALNDLIFRLDAALAKPEKCSRRKICEREVDGYCARCHAEMYP